MEWDNKFYFLSYFRVRRILQWTKIPDPRDPCHCRTRMGWRWRSLFRSQPGSPSPRPPRRSWSSRRRRRRLSWPTSTLTSSAPSVPATWSTPWRWWSVYIPVSVSRLCFNMTTKSVHSVHTRPWQEGIQGPGLVTVVNLYSLCNTNPFPSLPVSTIQILNISGPQSLPVSGLFSIHH